MRYPVRCFRSVLLLVVALAVPQPVMAQNTRVELSGGYQWLDGREYVFPAETVEDNFSTSQGWYFDGVYRSHRVIGIVAEVGGGYTRRESGFANEGIVVNVRSDVRVHQFMGGAHLSSSRSARAVLFVRVLAGAVRTSVNATGTGTGEGMSITQEQRESRTFPALQFGAGVNVFLVRRIGVQLGFDAIRVFHADEDARPVALAEGSGTNVLRLSAGIVVPFAGR